MRQFGRKRIQMRQKRLLQGFRKKFFLCAKKNPSMPQIWRMRHGLATPDLHPLQWSLGRYMQLHPGKDGINRVVTVETPTGTFKRPITKLCILPMDPNAKSTSSTSSSKHDQGET